MGVDWWDRERLATIYIRLMLDKLHTSRKSHNTNIFGLLGISFKMHLKYCILINIKHFVSSYFIILDFLGKTKFNLFLVSVLEENPC